MTKFTSVNLKSSGFSLARLSLPSWYLLSSIFLFGFEMFGSFFRNLKFLIPPVKDDDEDDSVAINNKNKIDENETKLLFFIFWKLFFVQNEHVPETSSTITDTPAKRFFGAIMSTTAIRRALNVVPYRNSVVGQLESMYFSSPFISPDFLNKSSGIICIKNRFRAEIGIHRQG